MELNPNLNPELNPKLTGKFYTIVPHSFGRQVSVLISGRKVYMELGSYFLFLQEQIKDIIIISVLGISGAY